MLWKIDKLLKNGHVDDKYQWPECKHMSETLLAESIKTHVLCVTCLSWVMLGPKHRCEA